jgi:hypothetical protein
MRGDSPLPPDGPEADHPSVIIDAAPRPGTFSQGRSGRLPGLQGFVKAGPAFRSSFIFTGSRRPGLPPVATGAAPARPAHSALQVIAVQLVTN